MTTRKKIEYQPTITLIAAIGKQGQLGLEGELPWHCPRDLKFFKSYTEGKTVIVGPKTHLTLPELPGRNIVVDKNLVPASIKAYLETTGLTACVIGGAKTYAKWLPFVDRIIINKLDYDGPADTYMPPLWEAQEFQTVEADEEAIPVRRFTPPLWSDKNTPQEDGRSQELKDRLKALLENHPLRSLLAQDPEVTSHSKDALNRLLDTFKETVTDFRKGAKGAAFPQYIVDFLALPKYEGTGAEADDFPGKCSVCNTSNTVLVEMAERKCQCSACEGNLSPLEELAGEEGPALRIVCRECDAKILAEIEGE